MVLIEYLYKNQLQPWLRVHKDVINLIRQFVQDTYLTGWRLEPNDFEFSSHTHSDVVREINKTIWAFQMHILFPYTCETLTSMISSWEPSMVDHHLGDTFLSRWYKFTQYK